MKSKFLFKLILAGSGGSGKTTLLRRFTTGLFQDSTKMTIGVDFSVTSCTTKYGDCTLQIWDFGGEERFRSMLPSFCLGASGCLMLFDPLRANTFHELTDWVQIVRDNTKMIPIVLVSSKQDLIEAGHQKSMKDEDITDFSTSNSLNAYQTVSSKNGTNVKETFIKIAELMIEKNMK